MNAVCSMKARAVNEQILPYLPLRGTMSMLAIIFIFKVFFNGEILNLCFLVFFYNFNTLMSTKIKF